MPLSFDQARRAAGVPDAPYVPLSVRSTSGNTGLLSRIPGSYDSELAKANQGPPKASAAPVAGKQSVFTGLCTALNDYQQALVKQKKREIPDQYAIEFAPASVGASTVKRPGPQDTTTATMQTPDSAAKLLPENNAVNRVARTWPVKAGTQIIKVIDDVMRNSSFITDQQNVEINTATDPTTGIQTQTLNAKAGTGNFQWYKISVSLQDLGYDRIIRDHAFKITFIITPYAVAQMTSQYFPDSRYRGVHKAYQYWFTGANTQVLSYEQSYNNAYRLFLSGVGVAQQQTVNTDFRDQNRYIYMATSPDQSQGAKNYANEPGNNAASFLYDPTSLGAVKMRIVGDPAWLQQGEAGVGINTKTFDFNPFNSDGSINYDSQAVMFSMAFNTPDDYDFNTGLVNVNANNRNGQPQEYYTFQAVKCKSTFSKGRFEQELEGKVLVEKKTSNTQQAGRSTVATTATADTRSNALQQSQADAQDLENGANAGTGTGSTNRNTTITSVSEIQYDELGNPINSNGVPPTPQPSPPPGDPTSNGDIIAIQSVQANYNQTGGGFSSPQDAAAAVAAANGPASSLTAEQQQIQQLNNPQLIAKDDQ